MGIGLKYLGSGCNLHCLQGVEYSNAAINEGFAHFYAANFLNRANAEQSSSFVYYKSILWPECIEGAAGCEDHGDYKLNLPPVPFDASSAFKHRNQDPQLEARSNQQNGEFHLTTGTELDWLAFLMALNRNDGFDAVDLVNIFRLANSNAGITFDGSPQFPDGDPTGSFIGVIELELGEPAITNAQNAGLAHGVSPDLSP